MFNVETLHKEFIKRDLTYIEVGNMLGLCQKTFSTRMKLGTFTLPEIDFMVEKLGIPLYVFFPELLSDCDNFISEEEVRGLAIRYMRQNNLKSLTIDRRTKK